MFATRENSDLKYIMLHHTTNSNDGVSIQDLIRLFVRSNQFGPPYDIIIDKSGRMGLTARWIYGSQGKQFIYDANLGDIVSFDKHHLSTAGSTAEENNTMIHIALIGHFDYEYPAPIQVGRLKDCIAYLQESIPSITDVLFHSDKSTTSCPGRYFPTKAELGIGDQSATEVIEPEYEYLTPATYSFIDTTPVLSRQETPSRIVSLPAQSTKTTKRVTPLTVSQGKKTKRFIPQSSKTESHIIQRFSSVQSKIDTSRGRITTVDSSKVASTSQRLTPQEEVVTKQVRRFTPQEETVAQPKKRIFPPSDFENQKMRVVLKRNRFNSGVSATPQPIKFSDTLPSTVIADFSSEDVFFSSTSVTFDQE